jgi:succinoglycan biosynthesis protein ExoM
MNRISVCICTFKRSSLLPNLLRNIESQVTENLFEPSVVVIDNDSHESARRIVEQFAEHSTVPIAYACEPEQNIAKARNKAVANADGDYIAFVDDDELPDERWLLGLYQLVKTSQASGALGPVLPFFPAKPPAWVVKGRVFERPSSKTGEILDWQHTRTGNVLLRRTIFDKAGQQFNVEYGRGGEDKDFFRRMITLGHSFVWCNEAIVREIVPPSRCTRSFVLRRALLRGKVAIPVPFTDFRGCVKSFCALCIYLPFLLVLLFLSQGLFMRYLIKTCDHVGRLLAFFGLNVIKENYIS